ncbi:MAG: SURF1 family cytochrome oxidase biogenesis protein, partial [Pseudomonadota bacterium]
AKNIWFARDVARMAEALGTEPVLIVAETHPEAAAGNPWPRPQPPGTGLPNRHLEYALTWYGLGIVWVVMTIVWVASMRRGGTARAETG